MEFTFEESRIFVNQTLENQTDSITLNRYLIDYSYTGSDGVAKFRPYIVIANLLYLSPANNIQSGDGVRLEGNKDVATRYLNEQLRLDTLHNYNIPTDSPISAVWGLKRLLETAAQLESSKKGQVNEPISVVIGAIFPC